MQWIDDATIRMGIEVTRNTTDMAILGFPVPDTGVYEISFDEFFTLKSVQRIR